LARSSERVWHGASASGLARACLAAVALALTSRAASAQLVGLDRLQVTTLDVDVGRIRPNMTVSAAVFGLGADYGRLTPTLRLRFDVGYWESRLTDEVLKTFTDSLHRVVVDPSGDDLTVPTRVNLYDVMLGTSVRWMPRQATLVQPFVGAGVALHVINAEGPLIDGTFVERLFDNATTGLFAEGGLLLKPLPSVGLTGRVRGDLVNGFRALSLRAGGVYYFGPLRSTDQ
jgi:hypothetical protein